MCVRLCEFYCIDCRSSRHNGNELWLHSDGWSWRCHPVCFPPSGILEVRISIPAARALLIPLRGGNRNLAAQVTDEGNTQCERFPWMRGKRQSNTSRCDLSQHGALLIGA